MKLEPVIGLEIHCELKTKSKMFCSCPNNPEEPIVNSNVCPICMGHPGTLPVINREAVRKVLKAGMALDCTIAEVSKFDRKNYFYPDLPKGYQITQYDMPFCSEGLMKIEEGSVRITRIHLEEDTGKLLHPSGADHSLVDFNRAGVPLMELVTEPDIKSGLQAKKFGEELQLILRYLNVSDADMEKGHMRVEVNISMGAHGKMGTKVEIKNLNSFKSVERAVDYEIKRQTELLEKGEMIAQETRGWNDDRGTTVIQRQKEEAHDYRYFPEPDLPTLYFNKDFLEAIKAEIPELPSQRKKRMMEEYFLDGKTVDIFVRNKSLGEYFERVVSEFQSDDPGVHLEKRVTLAANYLISDLQGLLQGRSTHNKDFKITAENFAEFISLIDRGDISSKIAKNVLTTMLTTGSDPSVIIEEQGLAMITDEASLIKIISQVILQNPRPVEDYKKGKSNALQFLAGRVMAATKGTAKPETVQQLLKEVLN